MYSRVRKIRCADKGQARNRAVGEISGLDTFEAAARAALPQWGLERAELALAAHRENAVFHVTAAGAAYALRVHRPGYHDDAELASELEWMRALAAAGVEVPKVVPTRSGELFARAAAAGAPAPLQIDVFAWIEGEQLRTALERDPVDAGWLRRTWHALGALAADLHSQAAGWQPPAGFVRHAWDADGLAGPDPLWGRFWEHPALDREQRELMLATRDRVHRELVALPKTPDAYGLIHADLLPENVLVDGERVRLIDFDDCGYGWHVFELVTPLYAIRDAPWHDAAREALVAGYRAHRALDEELFPLFFLVRALTDLGWMHTRAETESARRQTPAIVASACSLAEDYLAAGGSRRR